jgi:hypothetical protein
MLLLVESTCPLDSTCRSCYKTAIFLAMAFILLLPFCCCGSLTHWAKSDVALCSAVAQVPHIKEGPSVGVFFP